MSLSKKIKVGLDEIRILVLGAQILLGFQFQAVFRQSFAEASVAERAAWCFSLLLITTTIAFLLAPGAQHRLVERGRDSARLLRVIGTYAAMALLPFAFGLGLDVFISVNRAFGTWEAIVAGGMASLVALLFWFGLQALEAHATGQTHRGLTENGETVEDVKLEAKIEQMLTETRVVLPGAQALLGFQLIITLSQPFETLPPQAKAVHVFALAMLVLATIWLMAPAAFHRIVFHGEDSPDLHRIGSRFLLAATLALALGIGGDVGVAVYAVTKSALGAGLAAALALSLLIGLWHLYPLMLRWRRAPESSA